MILGFKTHFPDGRPTWFPQKIMANFDPRICLDYRPKIHTLREGNRWKEGMDIHLATGVRTNAYFQFWDTIKCTGVQFAMLHQCAEKFIWVGDYYDPVSLKPLRLLETEEMLKFAQNDGFETVDDLFKWFFPKPVKDEQITVQIIHFTDFKY